MARWSMSAMGACCLLGSLYAQNTPPAIGHYYALLRQNFEERNAYNTVLFMDQYWRFTGNKGFNESIFYVEKILRQAGFVKEIHGEADGPLTYRIESSPLQQPAWEPVQAQLMLQGADTPLLAFGSNRNMLAIYSASTPPQGMTAEVVDIGAAEGRDIDKNDLHGKIAFAEGPMEQVYAAAVKHGAIGVLAYSVPPFNRPRQHPGSISFQSIPYSDTAKWGILLSYKAMQTLKAALQHGPVYTHVLVQTRTYPATALTLVANVRGALKPEDRFVFSAHVQEPGANDNASGVGTLAEMARVTGRLVAAGQIRPLRSITFLWGEEITAVARYIQSDTLRAKGIRWGLSLDMVGEDIQKTGGSFLIEKMPDPSAIWTRGNDRHTEWGGHPLQEKDLFPHYYNDFLLNRCKEQTRLNGWIVNTNPFEGGSDHTPFLEARIPGALMWHFTDVFYHTDGDRPENVSPLEMRNVGISALAAACILTGSDEHSTLFLIDEIGHNALQRLRTEFELSRAAIGAGAAVADEKHILEVWSLWYRQALLTMREINVYGATRKIDKAIAAAQTAIDRQTKEYLSSL